jgi:hypothetical protein
VISELITTQLNQPHPLPLFFVLPTPKLSVGQIANVRGRRPPALHPSPLTARHFNYTGPELGQVFEPVVSLRLSDFFR